MGQFERHVFVCTAGRTCPRQGSLELFDALRVRVKEAGLSGRIRVNRAGCFAQCGHGPMVVVYPEDLWYGAVRSDHAARLLEDHLLGGRPLEELLYRPDEPGIRICPPGREPIPPRREG
ncbi:MAG: ferredoxin [Planctomycetota bacterium]